MPFIWSTEPNLPPEVPPIIIGPEEVSYKVHVVANTVNAGGTVSYNTPNVGYDVIYELDSLNVRNMRVQTGIIGAANIRTAIINNATINQASINTANITHATINIGYFTGNPTANFSMVSKQYVDNAIANISGGSGPDLTANIFQLKGDLLVGFAPNTAHRLGSGSDGQILTVANSSNLKQRWVDAGSTQAIDGLHMGTHHHPTLKYSQVLIRHVDGLVMNDGEYVGGWDGMVADITVSGAGGRDSVSAEAANTWYEVWAIRNSGTGAKALLLHRMLDRTIDQSWPALIGINQQAYLRRGEPALSNPFMRYTTKVSQSFVPSTSHPISGLEVRTSKVTALGNIGHLWVSIQGDDGLGNADGSIIATSESHLVTQMVSGICQMHFVFDTAVPVSSGGRYHMVFEGDWPIGPDSNSISIGFAGNTSPLGPGQQAWMANVGYTRGNLTINSGYGDCRIYNGVTGTWMVSANATGGGGGPQDLWFQTYGEDHVTSLALPGGYNQKALISFVFNNGSSNFKEYHQLGRVMTMGYDADWLSYTTGTDVSITLIPVHFDTTIPPITCAVQIIGNNPIDQATDHMFGFRTAFGIGTDVTIDFNTGPYGTYGFGAGGLKTILSHVMAMDSRQLLNYRQVGVSGLTYHIANITF